MAVVLMTKQDAELLWLEYEYITSDVVKVPVEELERLIRVAGEGSIRLWTGEESLYGSEAIKWLRENNATVVGYEMYRDVHLKVVE